MIHKEDVQTFNVNYQIAKEINRTISRIKYERLQDPCMNRLIKRIFNTRINTVLMIRERVVEEKKNVENTTKKE